jgi:hypothetical protein
MGTNNHDHKAGIIQAIKGYYSSKTTKRPGRSGRKRNLNRKARQ